MRGRERSAASSTDSRANESPPRAGPPPATPRAGTPARPPVKSPKRVAVLAGALGLAALVLSVGLGAFAPGAREVEGRLLALPKNAPARAALRRRTVELALDGELREVEVAFLHAPGPPAAEGGPVVLVHGTPACLFDWTELVFGSARTGGAGLADEREVFALDLPAHGITSAEPLGGRPLTFQRCAEWVAGFLAALDLEDVVLVGHSYGGEAAWRAALDAPERVAKLVLVDSAGLRRAEDAWLPEERDLRELALAPLGWLVSSEERVRSAFAVHFRGEPPADLVREMALLCERPASWRAMVDLARDEEGRREAELGRLGVPTLLVFGERDLAYPPATVGRAFERAVPGSRLVAIEDAGHYPHHERPAELLALLRAFL